MNLSDNTRRLVPVIFAVITGLGAMVIFRNVLQQERQKLEAERARLMENYREPVPVIVAATDLGRDVVIDQSHLAIAEVPERFIQPYAVQDPSQLLGLVTVAQIAQGEQILMNKLRRPEEAPIGSTLSSVTPTGKRAVTIVVDQITGVGGFVRPGDKVDILWTIQLPAAEGKEPQMLTLNVFQDVPILAMGSIMLGQAGADAPPAEGQAAQQNVTLALVPQEISLLLFARQHGQIQLSLRPRLESGTVAVSPVDINVLMQKALGLPPGFQQQAQDGNQQPAQREVEVFKGLQRDVVVLNEQKQ